MLKISSVLQEGFTFATSRYLNMGHYAICLYPDASKICTIMFCFPWGKYSYLQLPMDIAGSPNIFWAKMSELMAALKFV